MKGIRGFFSSLYYIFTSDNAKEVYLFICLFIFPLFVVGFLLNVILNLHLDYDNSFFYRFSIVCVISIFILVYKFFNNAKASHFTKKEIRKIASEIILLNKEHSFEQKNIFVPFKQIHHFKKTSKQIFTSNISDSDLQTLFKNFIKRLSFAINLRINKKVSDNDLYYYSSYAVREFIHKQFTTGNPRYFSTSCFSYLGPPLKNTYISQLDWALTSEYISQSKYDKLMYLLNTTIEENAPGNSWIW